MHQHFDSHILPWLNSRQPRKILEIGVRRGETTHALLRWCGANGAFLTSVDPVAWEGDLPDHVKPGCDGFVYRRDGQARAGLRAPALEAAYREGLFAHFTCRKETSLGFLAGTQDRFDLVLQDGDPNFYTFREELRALDKGPLAPGSAVLINTVTGDWARRDFYHDKTLIPAEYVDGPQAGVMTAVEDFLAERGGLRCGRLAEIVAVEDEIAAAGKRVPMTERARRALAVMLRGADRRTLRSVGGSDRFGGLDRFAAQRPNYLFAVVKREEQGLGILLRLP